ncbi:hypothetical protein DSO57_1005594 [Entomophthora muscae]|uniref:Uncharacterized protein n=1 Tax=Entomophthora muscae TaxID=34485 RepID=A0ACC2UTB0_9FUNG|nr:hypothetical protein DSO57_1005594 [Entomophthora muscae]
MPLCMQGRMLNEPIHANTRGCFYSHTPLELGSNASWAGTPRNFRDFHLNSTLKKSNFIHLKESVHGAGINFSQTYYIFNGCKKIKPVDCPQLNRCFYTMSWTNRGWHVETYRFPLHAPRLPQYVAHRVKKDKYFVDFYHKLVAGPYRGHLCFNQLKWGANLKAVTPKSQQASKKIYTNTFLLPSNIPDGVVGLI